MDTVSWAIELSALPKRVVCFDFRYNCDDFRLRSQWPPPTIREGDEASVVLQCNRAGETRSVTGTASRCIVK
jgi:hypothetical protein